MSRLERILSKAEELDGQFDNYGVQVDGRTLLWDADSTVYVAAATTKSLETAKTRFCSGVLTAKFLAQAQQVRIELTARECAKANRGRLRGVKPYQGNRNGKPKPPMVEPLRKAIGRNMFNMPPGEHWYVNLNYHYEADDTLIMDAWALGIGNAVVGSADKDLRCWPGHFLDPYTNEVLEPCVGVGDLWFHETASGNSLVGHGPIFFWAQMLMGDTADNVAGLKGCGKGGGPRGGGAWGLLEHLRNSQDESVVAELVLREYMKANQNPWPEAYAMWLYRSPEYGFAQHLNTLELSQELRAWLHKMFNEEWYAEADEDPDGGDAESGDWNSLPDIG